MIRMLFIVVLSILIARSQASDQLREQLIADEMASRLDPAEIIQLEANKFKFKALYRQTASKDIHGAVIILHDFDTSADALDILQPLRIHLPEHGWNSLSLQVPLREEESDFQDSIALLSEAVDRIKAGAAYLQTKGIKQVMLIGYHGGGLMALRYLAGGGDAKGAVLIDLPVSDASESIILADLAKVKKPLLDIYTFRDKNLSSDFAQKRKKTVNENPYYKQTLIIDTESNFVDVDGLLLNRIHGWMMRTSMM